MKILLLILLTVQINAQEFYLIRHGEYKGDSLTEIGKSQINDAATSLGKGIVAIYHSPKTRTKESAEIISTVTGCNSVKPTLWLSDDSEFSPNDLLEIKEDIVVIISHGPILAKIAKTLGSNTEKWGYAQVIKVKK